MTYRVSRAASVVIKVLLKMMKRPIAHFDPALYCAHVMFYHRAPFNPGRLFHPRMLCDARTHARVLARFSLKINLKSLTECVEPSIEPVHPCKYNTDSRERDCCE